MRHDLRVVPAAVAGWGCALWTVGQSSRPVLLVAIAGCAAAVILRRRPALALITVAVSLLAISSAWRITAVEQNPVTRWADEQRSVTAEATVRTDARETASGTGVVALTLRRVDSSGGQISTRAKVTAFVRGDLGELVVGRTLLVTGKLSPTETTSETATLSVTRWRLLDDAAWWWEASERVRSAIRSSVAHHGGPAAALVPALVTGDAGGLDEGLRDDFRRTGLTHLTAVSGSNLTIVLGAVLLLVRATGARRLILPAALLAVLVFVLVARPEPSVQRAAVMGTVAVVGLGWGTRDGLRAVSWAVLALLLLDPWMSRAAGFILSVCATTGIVVLGPPLTERFSRWMPAWAAMAVSVPLSAHMACLPVIAMLSSEVSLVAVLTNVVAAPAVAPATILGLSAGLVWLAIAPVGQLLGSGATGSAWWIVETGRVTAAWDGAAISWHRPWWVLLLLLPFAIAAVIAIASRPILALGLCLGLLVGMIRPPQPGWPPDGVVMVACDVGQGDASVVPTGRSEAIVVDVGVDAAPVDRCLRRLGIERIRVLVFSHADADHVGGWRGAVRGRRVDEVMVGPSGGPDAPATRRTSPEPGDRTRAGPVEIETLWPDHDPAPTDRNDASLVQRITVDQVSLLFTGDLGEEAQRQLLRRVDDVSADVVKVSHHGSADQSPELYAATGAQIATVSAGADNSYGHPTASALSMLREARMTTGRTDLHGDVAVVRDGSQLRLVSP